MAYDITQWEYTEADVKNIQELNRLGREGWELMGAKYGNNGLMGGQQIYKRPVRPQPTQQSHSGYSNY